MQHPEDQAPPENRLRLLDWSAKSSVYIGHLFDFLSREFSPSNVPDERQLLVLWQLLGSCHTTSESALILIANNRPWDADMLVRSVVEGSLKFVFLTLGSQDERNIKFHEFDDMLGDIGQIRRHSRIEKLLSAIDKDKAIQWKPYRDMLLPVERYNELQAKYSKRLKHQIEHKWSFGEICASLGRGDHKQFSNLSHLMFNYGMSSHVAHQDIDGIGMVWERTTRNPIQREAVELAHGGRLISDVRSMAKLRTYAFCDMCSLAKDILKNSEEDQVEHDLKQAEKSFHNAEYGGFT
jgi:hypothetical protein